MSIYLESYLKKLAAFTPIEKTQPDYLNACIDALQIIKRGVAGCKASFAA